MPLAGAEENPACVGTHVSQRVSYTGCCMSVALLNVGLDNLGEQLPLHDTVANRNAD